MSDETVRDDAVDTSPTGSSSRSSDGEDSNQGESEKPTVTLLEVLPSSPINETTWDTIGSIDRVLSQRPVYPMNDEGAPPRENDDLGSFLLEIEGLGWRGYHYTPENSEWQITFTGKDYNMVLDMHEDYVLPHMERLMEMRNEAEEKKQELLDRDCDSTTESDSDADTDSDSGSEAGVDEDAEADADTDETNDSTEAGQEEHSDNTDADSSAATPAEGS